MISFDTETALLRKGDLAPKFICASTARVEAGANCVGRLIDNAKEALSFFRGALEHETIAFANAAYDLGVMAQLDPSLFPLIFRAIEEGRIFDVLIAEALHAIGKGHLGMEPCPRCQREAEARRQEIRSYLEHKERQAPNLIKLLEEAANSTPTKSKYDCEVCKDRKVVPLKTSAGKVTNRYSLDVVVKLNLDRTDAKARDDWRLSYALLDGISSHRWPETARVYPVDDAINTLQVAYRQLASHLNLGNMRQQVAAAFALHLGAAHGLRVDPSRVEALKKIVDDKHDKAVAYFQSRGWIRDTGSEDQIAIKTAVALAYGASKANPCKVCKGTGLSDDCNGEKEEEGWARCRGQDCKVCDGTGKLKKPVTCKVITSPKGNIRKPGCDGTGLDISYLVDLPRTSKKGIATDRDSLLEADDAALLKFAENEFEKSRTTYVPYLLTGSTRPLSYTPNVLVATGRCSYEGSPLHQMPRAGGERETIRARGAWCGYPIEMVLGSTDYEAGELCTLGQYAKWVTGGTAMVDAINAASPGILHSELAASILRLPLDEFLKRLKAKDKQAVDFRQMSKAINFGSPGGMGAVKLVLTSRKKNAGFTLAPDGPAQNVKDERGYWGVRFCILAGFAERCGDPKITFHEKSKRKIPPVCEKCLEVVETILRPAYFARFPEIKEYFTWVAQRIEDGELAPCYVWDADKGQHVAVRWRATEEFPAYCNNGFQSMLSDIGKDAFYQATKECYTGLKPDGSPSPLFGSRMPIYLHDEPLSELRLDMAHLAGPRIAEIMIASGKKFAPDIKTWSAETAIAFRWNKGMEPTYEPDPSLPGGRRLVPWDKDKR